MNTRQKCIILAVTMASAICTAVAVAQTPPLEVKGIALGASQQDIIKRFRLDTVPLLGGAPDMSCSASGRFCQISPELITKRRCPAGRTPNFGTCISESYDFLKFGPILPNYYHFTLRDDKVVSISVSIVTEAYDKLVVAVTEKYGAPTTQSVETVQNRMGAKFENRKVRWERSDGFISIDERGSDLTQGYFLMSTREFMEAEAKKSSEAAKASASKL